MNNNSIKSDSILKKRIKRFKSIKRGYYSLIILTSIYIISLIAPVLISKEALIVRYANGIYDNGEKANKITSLIAILGAINIPIIKYSVDWWSTLHQPASINIFAKTSIHSSMIVPLALMTAAFALFSILIFLMKYNTELIKIKNKGLDRL